MTVIVAYASRHGATKGIAERIGAGLRAEGLSADVKPVSDIDDIDDYSVEGMVSGEYHLYGPYQGPFGFGTLTIDEGIAYGEPFERATAAYDRIDLFCSNAGIGGTPGGVEVSFGGVGDIAAGE